jgi:hypothetical protein
VPDDAEGARQLVLRCAWCDRIKNEDGVWLTVPPEELERLEADNLLTHGMCRRCFDEQMKGQKWADVG